MDEELEARLQKVKPPVEREDDPAGHGQLWLLNAAGLMSEALQRASDDGVEPTYIAPNAVITKIVAWQVLADAQRRGVTLPTNPKKTNARRPWERSGERRR